MEKVKPRKRIIDNTSVPLSRRNGKHTTSDNVGNGDTCVAITNHSNIDTADSKHHKPCGEFDGTYKDKNIGIVIKYRSNESDTNNPLEVINENRELETHMLLPRYRDIGRTRTQLSHAKRVSNETTIIADKDDGISKEQLGILTRESANINVRDDILNTEHQKESPSQVNVMTDLSNINKTKPGVNTPMVSEFDSKYTNTRTDKTVMGEIKYHLDYNRGVYDVLDHQPPSFEAKLFDFVNGDDNGDDDDFDENAAVYDAYSNMTDKTDGSPRLLSVEEKWQIIFNEKSRAPIYAVSQYIDYLKQFVDEKPATSPQNNDVRRQDGINPVTYLLRKLKLDLKMSYDSFLEEFLKPENKGLELLIKLLKSIQNTGSQQSGSTNMSQLKNYKKTLTDEHDCLLCIKFSLRIKSALVKLLEIPYGLETVSMGLLSTFTKSRGTAIEILTVTLSETDGFSRTLECFTFLRLKIGEPFRFKSLLNMMNMDSPQNIIFKVSSLKFLNSLTDCSPNYNHRVFLQHELECAGLDVEQMKMKVDDRTGLEFDDLRYELDQWERKYINVDDIVKHNVLPPQHQQHLIDELNMKVQALSKENSYLERQLKAVGTELRIRYEELQRRTVPTQDVCVQCESTNTETKSVGCQCSQFDEFGNPLKTAALYFGWQETMNHDTMNYHDYQVNVEGQGQEEEEEESDTDHVIKVEDWLRTRCDSPNLDLEASNVSGDEHADSRQYFRRQHSVRHKHKKTDFTGNWHLTPKPVNVTRFPSRLEGQQCHTTNCDRCHLANRQGDSSNIQQITVHKVAGGLNPALLSSYKNVQLESQSSDSAIGGSGERLWNSKSRVLLHVSTEKSEEERLQDLITPDDSASACPEVEPFPDYSSVSTRLEKHTSYEAELSEVLREFEGHLSRYDTTPDFVNVPRSPEQVV